MTETIKYENGDTYEGGFSNGVKNGFGILKYRDGERYEGEWKNDKQNGKGIKDKSFKLGLCPNEIFIFRNIYYNFRTIKKIFLRFKRT